MIPPHPPPLSPVRHHHRRWNNHGTSQPAKEKRPEPHHATLQDFPPEWHDIASVLLPIWFSPLRAMPYDWLPPYFRNQIDLPCCLLYTSDAADEEDSVDLGGRRII